MSNSVAKLAPLMPCQEIVRSIAPLMTVEEIRLERPHLSRSTNSTEQTRVAISGLNTPSPLSPVEVPPALTREDEKRRITSDEIAEIARKLW